MKPKVILSLPPNGGRNYFDAFEYYGFYAEGAYLADDTGADALVLCGGGDISPGYYGEENNGSNPPDSDRDRAEFKLFEKYRSAGKPIFGICRGMQLINAALGGSLIQHLDTACAHGGGNGDLAHEVINMPGTPALSLFGEKMTVNSSHHQGCGSLGAGLSVMQKHKDGVIEGIFADKILAVQWHPERMTCRFYDEKYADPAPLFNLFFKMTSGS